MFEIYLECIYVIFFGLCYFVDNPLSPTAMEHSTTTSRSENLVNALDGSGNGIDGTEMNKTRDDKQLVRFVRQVDIDGDIFVGLFCKIKEKVP